MTNGFKGNVLFVPSNNLRAIEKARGLDVDAIVFDLEDSVPPHLRSDALEFLVQTLPNRGFLARELLIRVPEFIKGNSNALLASAHRCRSDGIVLPKVETPRTLALARACAGPDASIFAATIETPKAILKAGEIAAEGAEQGLACLMVGVNDIARTTGVSGGEGRILLVPWLMQIVLAAKSAGLGVIDSVHNSFTDLPGLESECRQAAAMGFDGKALIHPAQIAPANAGFSPSAERIAWAHKVIEALSSTDDRAVISIDGAMVEQLHLEIARNILERVKSFQPLSASG